MAFSVAQVVTRAQLAYNDITLATNANGITLSLLNEIQEELSGNYKIYSELLYGPLTAGQREITIPDTTKGVWACDYLTAANVAPIPLLETSVDELDSESPGWRFSNLSMPTLFYVDNSQNVNVIGFDWLPSVTTSPFDDTGFPIVRYLSSTYVPLTALGNIPITLRSPAVYVKGLISKWAEYRGKPDKADRMADYEFEKTQLESYLITKQKNNPPKIRPFYAGGVPTR